MRYYRPDGTYHDHPLDTEFGWFFEDIAIDEAASTYREKNENIKKISRVEKCLSGNCSQNCDMEANQNAVDPDISDVDEVEESVDVLENLNPKPVLIHKIEPNIKEETPTHSTVCEHSVEGFIENPESNFYKHVKNYKIPCKDNMVSLISPVNPESKALLSVVSYSKYRGLNDKEIHEEVLKTINFKTTNSKRLINEKGSPLTNRPANFLLNAGKLENIHFLLNDNEMDKDTQLTAEIQNYHATKEENMLSLMMELIITDMDSNVGDMTELNNSVNELNNTSNVETSDLGNSIHSSILSKEGNGFKEKGDKKNYLEIPNRSDVLSSIGLSEDIDRSIECFLHEKTEMHQQLTDIKKSFESFDKEIDTLMDQACTLQNDLRETTYLNNLIHLLKGQPEKVKNKRLPFRIFHQSIANEEANENLII